MDEYECEISQLDEEVAALPGLRRQLAATKDEQLELMREVYPAAFTARTARTALAPGTCSHTYVLDSMTAPL